MGRFEGTGEIVRRRTALLVLAVVSILLGMLQGYLLFPPVLTLIMIGVSLLWPVAFVAWAVKAWPRRRPCRIGADATGLTIDDRLVARRRMQSAYRVGKEPGVCVVRRFGPKVDVRVASEADAGVLLAALGFDVGRSVATFQASYDGVGLRRGAGCLSVPLGFYLMVRLAFLLPTAWLLASFLALFLPFVLLIVSLSATVVVGSDGVLVRRLGRGRFLSFTEVTRVRIKGQNLVLALRDGHTMKLGVDRGGNAGREYRDALAGRIEEARAAFVRDHGTESVATLVAPGGRPAERWVKEVRELARAREYRAAALDPERLWRLVDDAGAPADARAGAALALSGTLDDASRVRLRVASEACADPKLRVALARVAEGAADEAVDEAIAPLASREG